MDEFAKAFATNYYLQSAAIIVSLAIIPYWIWKIMRSFFEFFQNVVAVGLKRTVLRIKYNLAKKAIFDSNDPILFQSRVIQILLNLIFCVVFFLIFDGFGTTSDLIQSDKDLFGVAFDTKIYWLFGLLIFILKYMYLFLAFLWLAQLDAYAKMIRKCRIKRKRRNSSK